MVSLVLPFVIFLFGHLSGVMQSKNVHVPATCDNNHKRINNGCACVGSTIEDRNGYCVNAITLATHRKELKMLRKNLTQHCDDKLEEAKMSRLTKLARRPYPTTSSTDNFFTEEWKSVKNEPECGDQTKAYITGFLSCALLCLISFALLFIYKKCMEKKEKKAATGTRMKANRGLNSRNGGPARPALPSEDRVRMITGPAGVAQTDSIDGSPTQASFVPNSGNEGPPQPGLSSDDHAAIEEKDINISEESNPTDIEATPFEEGSITGTKAEQSALSDPLTSDCIGAQSTSSTTQLTGLQPTSSERLEFNDEAEANITNIHPTSDETVQGTASPDTMPASASEAGGNEEQMLLDNVEEA